MYRNPVRSTAPTLFGALRVFDLGSLGKLNGERPVRGPRGQAPSLQLRTMHSCSGVVSKVKV
jgi:hypothetical protein